MSGGSMDYFFGRVRDVADSMDTASPLRRAFVAHLMLVSQALHDIEWVDSCDYGPGDENAAIRACLPPGAEAAAAADALRDAMRDAEAVLARLTEGTEE
jgi:hypothetical protein